MTISDAVNPVESNATVNGDTTLFMVSIGEYDDYGVHSVWSNRDEALKVVELLNNEPYSGGGQARLETILFNTVGPYALPAWGVTYDFKKFGFPVQEDELVVVEMLTHRAMPWTHETYLGVVNAIASTREEARQLLVEYCAAMEKARIAKLEADSTGSEEV